MNIPALTPPPFEMHATGMGGFTVFECNEAVALPLLNLSKATLRGTETQRMGLEYRGTLAVVEGKNLGELFGHVLSGRVKAIRCGKHGTCLITAVQLIDT